MVTTPTLGLLRGLVVANAALFLLALALAMGYGMLTSTDQPETLGMQSPQAGIPELLVCCALVILVPVHIAGLIGLFLLRNWGRWLHIGMLILFNSIYLIASLFDVSATWRFPDALSQVEAVVSGLILGLVFYSPLACKFAADAPLTH